MVYARLPRDKRHERARDISDQPHDPNHAGYEPEICQREEYLLGEDPRLGPPLDSLSATLIVESPEAASFGRATTVKRP